MDTFFTRYVKWRSWTESNIGLHSLDLSPLHLLFSLDIQVLKYDSVEHVDHVDLDEEVVQVCKEHFHFGAGWEDARTKLHISDGSAFVLTAKPGSYDVIIQDSSDPWTEDENGNTVDLPSSVLYETEHFKAIYKLLAPGGIFNFQAESFNFPSDVEGISTWRKQALAVGFQRVRYGSLMTSTYTAGQIGFLLCEKDASAASSLEQIAEKFASLEAKNKGTTYYQPKLQVSSFDLPLWVERAIYDDDDDNSGKTEL